MTTRLKFDRELQTLRDHVLLLGSMVDTAIERATQALKERDVDLAQQVILNDDKINHLRFEIEEQCYVLIARQQPMAGDLRAIIAAMNIAIELERIGDHAKGIATITQHIGQTAPIKPLVDIPRMAEISRVMLRQSLDAFVQHDPTLAHVVVEHDRAVNQLYNQVVRELISSIIEDPHRVIRAMDLMFAAHSLERLADRVTNICERVVYLSTGQLAEFSDDSPHV